MTFQIRIMCVAFRFIYTYIHQWVCAITSATYSNFMARSTHSIDIRHKVQVQKCVTQHIDNFNKSTRICISNWCEIKSLPGDNLDLWETVCVKLIMRLENCMKITVSMSRVTANYDKNKNVWISPGKNCCSRCVCGKNFNYAGEWQIARASKKKLSFPNKDIIENYRYLVNLFSKLFQKCYCAFESE